MSFTRAKNHLEGFGLTDRIMEFDTSMRRFETVYPACGSANSAVRLALEELKDATPGSIWVDVCKLPDE